MSKKTSGTSSSARKTKAAARVARPAAPAPLGYNVRDFGAVGDGQTKDTAALAAAIAAASQAGGGTVYVPAGQYLTGTVALASRVTLHLDAGAVLLGSAEAADYPVLPAETIPGLSEDVRQSLIWALDCQDIAVVGRGCIDGQGANWWKPRAAATMQSDGRRLRETLRPRMVELLGCTNVRLEGITCRNSASWTIHPLCCDNVTVDGVTICNPPDSPNTDGINPEACSNVRIANCHIDVGDDGITIKSGKENEPFRSSRPCENITVTNCTMLHGHGGVVIGSEMAGGVRHVAIGNCVFDGTDRGIRIKTRRGRGNAVEHVAASNIVMRRVRSVVHFTMFYTGTHRDPAPDAHRVAWEPAGAGTPRIRNVRVSDVVAVECNEVGYLAGLPEMPMEDITLTGLRVTAGRALFAARVRGLTLRDVDAAVAHGPAVVCENVEDLEVVGLRDRGTDPATPTVQLTDVKGASVRHCRPGTSGQLIRVTGRNSQGILVGPNPLAGDQDVVAQAEGASASAVTQI